MLKLVIGRAKSFISFIFSQVKLLLMVGVSIRNLWLIVNLSIILVASDKVGSLTVPGNKYRVIHYEIRQSYLILTDVSLSHSVSNNVLFIYFDGSVPLTFDFISIFNSVYFWVRPQGGGCYSFVLR
jgi:hypothetical protein